MNLERETIIHSWEQDFEEDTYFINLKNGDSIGYCDQSEFFSLNNYWNGICTDEAESLIKKWGIDR